MLGGNRKLENLQTQTRGGLSPASRTCTQETHSHTPQLCGALGPMLFSGAACCYANATHERRRSGVRDARAGMYTRMKICGEGAALRTR